MLMRIIIVLSNIFLNFGFFSFNFQHLLDMKNVFLYFLELQNQTISQEDFSNVQI